MTVWMVVGVDDAQTDSVVGIYATEEKALRIQAEKLANYFDVVIELWEVE